MNAVSMKQYYSIKLIHTQKFNYVYMLMLPIKMFYLAINYYTLVSLITVSKL